MRAALVFAALLVSACEDGELDGPLDENPPPNAEENVGCSKDCHGSDMTNAPPTGIGGSIATTAVGVGAHASHMNPAPTWHRKVACADCHTVPKRDTDPGHIDGDDKAELTFTDDLAGVNAMWNGTTCSVDCHGQPGYGGSHINPTWTQVDGTQVTCGSCHGLPPPPPHPAVANTNNCAECHPTMEEGSLTFRDPDSHINGTIDVVDSVATGGCSTCHGMLGQNAAPPFDIARDTARSSKGVGAHQQHLGVSTWHRSVVCSDCHKVPIAQATVGHIDGDNTAEVIFGSLNPIATYNGATVTCASMYCHGNGRGGNGTMVWTDVAPRMCGDCHSMTGANMSGKHQRHISRGVICADCHSTVVDATPAIIPTAAALHINGVHETKLARGTWNPNTRQCSNTGCHNTRGW